jgi:hypothetical protein
VKAQTVLGMLNQTLPNQTEGQTKAMVTRWATADSNYEAVSKKELQEAQPALAKEWDQFAKGKDNVSTNELTGYLRTLSQKVNAKTGIASQPTAEQIKGQSLLTLLSKTIPNQTTTQSTAMVTRWATADSRYESVSKTELQAANPALAREWDQFAKGKETVAVGDMVSYLRTLSQKLSNPAATQGVTSAGMTATA